MKKSAIKNAVFQQKLKENPTYNAYEKDIKENGRRIRPWAACPRDNTGPGVSRSRRLKVRYSSLEQRTLMPIKACEGYRKRIIPRETCFIEGTG